MPAYRRTKFTCAYAEPTPRPRAPRVPKKPRKDMTQEERDEEDIKKLVNKSKRELKKEWEATLAPATQSPTFYWPAGTRVRLWSLYLLFDASFTRSSIGLVPQRREARV